MPNRLALGTVQFGIPYGIANKNGQISLENAKSILETGWSAGIDTLDTAINYGSSEDRLGEIGIDQWHVISKLPEIPQLVSNVTSWVYNNVELSLSRLKIPRLYGLLLHRPDQLLKSHGEELYTALNSLKDQNLVERIGISIYNPEELELLYSQFQFDLVQAPFNILDRRLLTSGWLTKMHNAGVEVHVRSIFLQGLLLLNSDKRPEKFSRWRCLWDQWDCWLEEQALTPLEACLGFALSQPEIDRVIVGVDNHTQLQEILSASKACAPMPPASLMTEDLDLVIPSRWDTL